MNKKILALLMILNLSFYTVFAERENGTEDRNERENEAGKKVRNFCPPLTSKKNIKEFQKRNHLSQTGKISSQTKKKFLQNCGTNNIPVPTTNPTSTPVTSNTKYRDGTYSVTTQYFSPGGTDNLGVQISLLKDKVTNVTVTSGAKDRTSSDYQDSFISRISGVVVGQSINNLQIGVVSGASLTSGSFNDALNKIRAQAAI